MRRVVHIHAMIGGLCLALGGSLAPAQAGMSVSPMKQEVTVRPGETAKVTVTIANNDREKLGIAETVQLELVDVKVVEEGGLAFPPIGSTEGSPGKWMTLSAAKATVKPNDTQQVTCTIAPPLSAQPGEYYAALLMTMEAREQGGTGVTLRRRTASGIFVTIPGRTFPKQAKIERCELLWPDTPALSSPQASKSAESQPADSTMPVISVVLRNTGRARFDASGTVRLQDARARVLFSAPLITKRASVFGGDTRLFEAVISKPLPAGRYTIKAEMDYQSSWGKARYQLPIEILPEQAEMLQRLTRRYEQGQAPIEVEPGKVSLKVRSGATRSLALAVRNVGDGSLQGAAGVAASQGSPADAWIAIAPAEFAVAKAGRRTVAVRVQVPAGTAGGTYTSAVILKVGSEGSPLLERVVPVEIEVQAEK